ncbi:MAG: tRNA (5-methylaminomethyl-2-thiouridine)(34)-methyltransferase MnmD, partial [Alphaproteobacteria bacterium]|nr:tRNA (5-methylaminomethyl-2-thiouridine)(34)-methyltransferase MnmD [Alphaproteobacteria bacterium]
MNRDLNWCKNTPYSTRFNDVYYSQEDGLEESRHVYLAGIDLNSLARGTDSLVRLGELGFGTGINFLASTQVWSRLAATQVLHYVAVEKYPLAHADLTRAYADFPEIADIGQRFLSLLPPRLSGLHRVWFAPNILLDLWFGDVTEVLPQISGGFSGWYMDGFSPKTNSEMFSLEVCQHIARLSLPGARVATFSVAGAVRRNLSAAGFSVSKVPGYGRKRQCLVATKNTQKNEFYSSKNITKFQIAILGGGIAGACCVEQIQRLGMCATVFSRAEEQMAASQVPIAAVAPRLSAHKTRRGQRIALAYAYALRLYHAYPEAILHHGAMKVRSQGFSLQRLQAACATWHGLGQHAPQMLDADQARQCAGVMLDEAVQYMPSALVLHPQSLIRALLSRVAQHQTEITAYHHDGTHWTLTDRHGTVYSGFDALVLACGTGLSKFLPAIQQHTQVKSSEIAYYESEKPPRVALGGWGGHLLPENDGFWLGRSQSELSGGEATKLTCWQIPHKTEISQLWSGQKLSVRGHWPLCGAIPSQPGLFALAGAGGHGFTLMPWLASHIALMVSGYNI